MTAIGASIREMAGMGVFGVMTMMIGNRITAIVTDARLQVRRRPKGQGAIGLMPMTSALMTGTGVRGTVGALTVMTAIGASIREMAGMGVFGVMTMMIGNRITAIGTDARLQSRRCSPDSRGAIGMVPMTRLLCHTTLCLPFRCNRWQFI